MSGAADRGHRVDAVALHWYGGDFDPARATEQLRQYLVAVHDRYHRPVLLTEYALMRFGPTTTPDPQVQAEFVRRSTRMLESLPFVERYAWFSFGTPTEGGLGTGLYRPGGRRTPMGAAYRAAGPA
jgi:Glycosyl hydrolase catalytic core